ncbi:MAG: hypothetical protein KKC79_15370 [Gammaproteobacteria bacterium]|nr:hypothetical protein [Gammaproteobacteria bacterium]MBU1441688.1 hypothetical protein [Gammaproteobacteria bacterium]MBU2289288.1 hypothetical protein [Gammaproteobacteria bacterium]MBU2410015.1 hypothetical protein [Gammaproteobacteria bacterium]
MDPQPEPHAHRLHFIDFRRFHRYSASTGRYLQADALGLDATWNRFTYALSNPLGFIDDDGLAPKKPGPSQAPVPINPFPGAGGGGGRALDVGRIAPLGMGAPGKPRDTCGPGAKPTPTVADRKLGNIVGDLYKGAKMPNPIGTGSTADAIRNELSTGLATGGRFHSQKGAEYIRALDNWLAKNPDASHYDRMTAESLRNDLSNALGN